MKRIVIIIVLVVFFCGCNATEQEEIKMDLNISANEIHESIGTNKYLVVDVRSKEEYENGHIPGAINVPFNEIDAMSFNYPKDTKIVLYCQSGNRSGMVKKVLEQLGYKTIYDFGALSNYTFELE